MAELVDRIPLDDGSGNVREIYDDGREIVRAPDGRIVESILPGDVASETGAAPRGTNKKRETEITKLLTGLHLDSTDAVLRTMGGLAVDGKYYSLAALQTLRKLAGQDDTTPKGHDVSWPEPYKGVIVIVDGVPYLRIRDLNANHMQELRKRLAGMNLD